MAGNNGKGKKGDAKNDASATAVLDAPPPENGQAQGDAHEGNGQQKRRPAASFAAMTDRTTRLEVNVWQNEYTNQQGEVYQQASLTLRRSWRDDQGTWRDGGSYRVHDVPVLMYLTQRAYDWCLAARTDVKVDGELPF